MILVVEGQRGAFDLGSELLGDVPLERARTIGEARRRLVRSDPTVLVITRALDESTAALIADVRTGRIAAPELPVVAVVDRDEGLAGALGIDVTVPAPPEAAALRDAIERARDLGRYRDAVAQFFELCREGDREAGDDRLAAARREADRWLSALQATEEPVPIESLLGVG